MMALEGLKVLDLTPYPPGHLCTMILGDFGAEVIRIEAPPTGNSLQIGASPTSDGRERACFSMNRNKKSLVLNLKSEEGRQIFHRLAGKADIVLESFRPGVTERLGIDYKAINKLNPKIIYCSMTGYGQNGPYHTLPGHDLNYIAVAGAMGLIGDHEGRPVVPLNLLGDFAGGSLMAAIGILIALAARERTGKGQYIDLAMMDGVILLLTQVIEEYLRTGVMPKRGETMASNVPHNNVYETKDGGFVAICCLEPWAWENLCHELGRDDLIPYKFRREHLMEKPKGEKWEKVSSFLEETFRTKTRDEWFELLKEKNISVSKVYSLDEVFADPQILYRQMLVDINHPTEGKVKQVGIAVKMSDTPGTIKTLSPLLGEQTEEILLDIGYSSAEIERFCKRGIVWRHLKKN